MEFVTSENKTSVYSYIIQLIIAVWNYIAE